MNAQGFFVSNAFFFLATMMNDPFVALHAPLLPILRQVITDTGLPRHGHVLDLASGTGGKLALLADACGPAATMLAIDQDHGAVAACKQRMRAEGLRGLALVGDAHALPLHTHSVAATCCIAGVGAFADPVLALREARRVTQPGGVVLAVGGTQQWAEIIRWPVQLHEPLRRAHAAALAEGTRPIHSPDIASDMRAWFEAAGFAEPHTRAFMLHEPDVALAELALLPWATARRALAHHMPTDLLPACDAAAVPEIELCTLAVAVQARA